MSQIAYSKEFHRMAILGHRKHTLAVLIFKAEFPFLKRVKPKFKIRIKFNPNLKFQKFKKLPLNFIKCVHYFIFKIQSFKNDIFIS